MPSNPLDQDDSLTRASARPVQWAVVLALLVVSLLLGGTTCYGAEEYVELRVLAGGLQVVQLQKPFFAPYVVEPGETFQSISTKFYGNPEGAQYLADALGVPVVHIPSPGSIAYIVSGSLTFQFPQASAARQKRTVEQFLALLPKGTQLTYQWATGNPSFTVTDAGKTVLTKMDVSGLLLTPVGGGASTLELMFPLRPLLTLISRAETLEDVRIQADQHR